MPFELPPFPPDTGVAAREIARRLGRHDVRPHTASGTCNEVWALGDDLLLRIPRDHPAFVDMLARETTAIPAARDAGVRTPEVVHAGAPGDLLPVPWLVVQRVRGTNLADVGGDPATAVAVWTELGTDLARLHTRVPAGVLTGMECEDLPRPDLLADRVAAAGHLHDVERGWLHEWLVGLDRCAAESAPGRRVFRHGDTQSTNIIVDPAGSSFLAVVDWGACGWGDAADDFAGVPLRAVPPLLAGYESVIGEQEPSFLARIVWRHAQIALFLLDRGAAPGHSWAERSTSMLVELLRFFTRPPERWASLGPPR